MRGTAIEGSGQTAGPSDGKCVGAAQILRRCRIASAIALACALTGALANNAQAAEPALVTDLTWGIPQADQARSVNLIADSGARWARLSVQWKAWETSPGTYAPWEVERTDNAVRLAKAAGIRILLDVVNAPAWASATNDSGQGNVPRDPADFAAFMRVLATRYQGQIDAYEIWNEPDIKRFWNSGPNAVAYTALLKVGYNAVKGADPRALVVSGGLSWDYDKFLNGMYRAGAKDYFDILAVHPYAVRSLSGWQESYRSARRTQLANSDTRPIWLTEFGFNTSTDPNGWQQGVTEDEQARLVTEAYHTLEQDPYVKVAFYYALRNNWWDRDNSRSMEACFGLLHTDFSPKPAFSSFRSYARESREAAPAPTATTITALKAKKKVRRHIHKSNWVVVHTRLRPRKTHHRPPAHHGWVLVMANSRRG